MKRLQPWAAMLVVLAGGMLFGYGLALSTMISPEVVLGFLTGKDYGLTLVMGGAVAITLVCYQLAPRWMDSPVMDKQFMLREAKLDRDTVLGSVIFGLGWGLCGVCPGPAIAGLGAGNMDMLWALTGIFAGAYAQGWLANRKSTAAHRV